MVGETTGVSYVRYGVIRDEKAVECCTDTDLSAVVAECRSRKATKASSHMHRVHANLMSDARQGEPPVIDSSGHFEGMLEPKWRLAIESTRAKETKQLSGEIVDLRSVAS
jgi:hypothetical protein